MKGLILKDLINLKKQAKVSLFLVLFYSVYAAMTKNMSMLGVMITVLTAMLTITTLAYDDLAKWDRFALSMPVTRKNIVVAKYVLGIILILAGFVLSTAVGTVVCLISGSSTGEMLFINLASCPAALFLLAVSLPVIFKFGVEKGRLLIMAMVLVPTILAVIFSKAGFEVPSDRSLILLAFLLPVIFIAVFIGSIFMSVSIYEQKEF